MSGGPFIRTVPEGDDRERLVCADCGHIAYENPKVVVGSVAAFGGRLLLCRRAIEPRKGFWTLPAGYLELHETPEDGAKREAVEEACAAIEIDRLLAVFSIPRLSQVQLIFRARLASPAVAPGPESADVRLVRWREIPWGELAFPSVRWALDAWRQTRGATDFTPLGNPPGETGDVRAGRPGVSSEG